MLLFALPATTRRELEKESVGACVVEFCCSPDSQLRRVTKEIGIEYLGLRRHFADLTDPLQVSQIEIWMTEQASHQKVVHLLGSLPTLSQAQRDSEVLLIRYFVKLAEVAACSGGAVTFEWPRQYMGWRDPLVLDLIARFSLQVGYPTGCAFRLRVGDKEPLMAWCVASSSTRLTTELARRTCRCAHPRQQSDEREAYKARFYITGPWLPLSWELCVQAKCMTVCQVVTKTSDAPDHVQREIPGMPGFEEGMVTKSLNRKDMLVSPDALETIKKGGKSFGSRTHVTTRRLLNRTCCVRTLASLAANSILLKP